MPNKILSITALLVLVINTADANEFCDPAYNETIDSFVEKNCEITDKMKTCAQKEPDPDALKKRIQALLKGSEDKQDDIQKYWNQSYSKTAYAQLFDYSKARAQNDSKYVPTHLFDWFTDSGKASVDRDKLKEKMVENYVKFAQKHECTPVIKHRYTVHHYPDNYKTENEAELKKLMSSADFEAKKNEYFDKYNERTLESGTYCEKDRVNTKPFHYVSEQYPPCSGNVSGLYKDNEWASSTLDAQLKGGATDEVISCIKDRLAKGAEIHHISVVSSASALNNSGEAAKKFCKKGFLELSKARAENARDKVVPQLFSLAGAENIDYKSKLVLNYKGSNGDGTSGPCPYTLKNGVEVLKSEYQKPEGKKELDKEKFVRIHVTFESKTKKVNDSKTYYAASYSCRNIYLDCEKP
ncbi:MAG: hypothetical protein ACLGHN_12435 [Bacteriovoracia bacterium]